MRSHQQATCVDLCAALAKARVDGCSNEAARHVMEVVLVRICDRLLQCFAFEPVYDVADEPHRAATDTIHAAYPTGKGKRRKDDGTAGRHGFE